MVPEPLLRWPPRRFWRNWGSNNYSSYMDTIPIILTSSLLSAFLTSFVNWLIQRNNYKNDYYKKLLDKRLSAYEEVESLTSKMRLLIHLEDGNVCNAFFSSGRQEYELFVISLMAPSMSSFWLSGEVSSKITELNVFLLNEVSYRIEDLSDEQAAITLEKLGVKHRESIKAIRKEIEMLIYKDLKTLHQIPQFIINPKLGKNNFSLNPPSNSKQPD